MVDPRNTGHGHVRPRPDGVKARCGGPALCAECARELAAAHPGPFQHDREVYLGDGLYASADAFGSITLRAPRGFESHYVVLEPEVLTAFERYIARLRAPAEPEAGA
jgi:hypothetical protein